MSADQAVELLPCPFCGSANIDSEGWKSLAKFEGTEHWRAGPACDDCGASADSVEAWNRRTATAAGAGDAADGWQSIETAPKDGTRILCGRFTGKKNDHSGYVAVDYWRRPEDQQGFLGFGNFNSSYWPPTHWQPLPTPPQHTERAGGEG